MDPEPDYESTPEALRRRLDAVFGDLLPTTTGDERDDREDRAPGAGEDELLANRPPHHDRD